MKGCGKERDSLHEKLSLEKKQKGRRTMGTQEQIRVLQERAAALLAQQGIVLAPAERAAIEIADFGLGNVECEGLEIVVYVNTERYCAKELVLFARHV